MKVVLSSTTLKLWCAYYFLLLVIFVSSNTTAWVLPEWTTIIWVPHYLAILVMVWILRPLGLLTPSAPAAWWSFHEPTLLGHFVVAIISCAVLVLTERTIRRFLR